MARRMFSTEITTTDAFLDMPSGSQLLYFHLGMNADDDGFISSPKMIMRIIGSTDDELKLLIYKKFLIAFDTGVCVVKHWRINNQIRKDRYVETKYMREKLSLFIRENGAYTLNPDGASQVPKGHFLPSGNQMATNGQPSIGKYSIDKDSIDNTYDEKPTRKIFVKPSIDEITEYCISRKNKINPQQFFNYYESNGWCVGRNKMKDWKAAVRTWEGNNYGNDKKTLQNVLIATSSSEIANKILKKNNLA